MAASNDNPRVIEEVDVQYMPIATTSTVVIGDLLYMASGKVLRMSAVAQSTAYVGVAGSNYPPANNEVNFGDFVKVYKRGVFTFNISATSAKTLDTEYRWASGGDTVIHDTSNAVGRLWKETVAADTTVQLRIDKYVAF